MVWYNILLGQVQYLLCKDVEVNFRVPHRSNNTPLHTAVSRGNEEIVKLLLEKLASTGARNDNGETPMQKAVKCRKRNMEYILRSYGNREIITNTVYSR